MELTKEQQEYCYRECPVGKAKSKEFLNVNNSAYDAALDMMWFVEKCAETCERCKSVIRAEGTVYGKSKA